MDLYKFDPGWVRPLCGLESVCDPSWVHPLCGLVLTLGGVRTLCGLISSTLVGSVHFVDCGVDPWWGPSTL